MTATITATVSNKFATGRGHDFSKAYLLEVMDVTRAHHDAMAHGSDSLSTNASVRGDREHVATNCRSLVAYARRLGLSELESVAREIEITLGTSGLGHVPIQVRLGF